MARILYAEDQGTIREFIREILEGECHEVFALCNGQEALECLDELGEIDLVMTDINMPVADGYDLIEGLNKRNLTPPLIVHSSDFDNNRVKYSGELRRVGKSTSNYVDELKSTIKELLDDS